MASGLQVFRSVSDNRIRFTHIRLPPRRFTGQASTLLATSLTRNPGNRGTKGRDVGLNDWYLVAQDYIRVAGLVGRWDCFYFVDEH